MANEMKGVRQRVADALAQPVAGNYCKAVGFPQVRLRPTSELVDFPNIQPVDKPIVLKLEDELKPE